MKIVRSRQDGILKSEIEILCHWIELREEVRLKRKAGEQPPWSDDALISTYRWCNVRRMDDKVSVWLLDWHQKHPEVDFQDRVIAAVAGRLINWPFTLNEVPYPVPFKPEVWSKLFLKRKARGEKIFTGAYIVNGALGGDKILQVTDKILTPLWKARSAINTHPRTMYEVWAYLKGKPGIGSFMAGQAVADLRYIHHELPWEDRHSWAPQGPGSVRGVNRLLGREARRSMPFKEWLPVVVAGYAQARARLPTIFERLELMDFQNCLCEYDKYSRLTKNEGQVRATYRPSGEYP